MQLSVIIVSYNVLPFLQLCIASLQHALHGVDAETMVVDNNSSDGSAEWLASQQKLNAICLEKNIGFGAANNLALAKARGEFVLMLNPDTICDAIALRTAINCLRNDENIGATGIRMMDGSGRFLHESKRGKPSALASFYRFSGLTAVFPSSKHFSSYYQGHLLPAQNHKVSVLAGAFIMARREVLLQLNGFDEQFFMYAEDIDLSYRINQLGFDNYYIGTHCIIHFKGESSYPLRVQYVNQFYQAMHLFVQKHYGARGRGFAASLLEKSIRAIAMLSALKRRRLQHKPLELTGNTLQMRLINQPQGSTLPQRVSSGKEQISLRLTSVSNNWLFVIDNNLNLNQLTASMQQAPASTRFWFTAPGLNFILSSSSADTAGQVLLFDA